MRYNLYIKQAWQLMRQERFFSAVYIISTGLAISMVMVLSISFYLKLANLYPENNLRSMGLIYQVYEFFQVEVYWKLMNG